MTSITHHQEPVEKTVARLEVYIGRMERRYERPSDQLEAAVGCGEIRETAEITRWLMSYRTLRRLKASVGAIGA